MTVKAAPHEIAIPSVAGIYQRRNPSAGAVLSGALAGKASTAALASGLASKADSDSVISALAAKADSGHSHAIANITSLQAALDAKALATDLTTGLANKAAVETSGSFTGTLTGVTGSVTDSIAYVKFAGLILLTVPDLLGTSNATSCTITGMPVAIRPSTARQLICRVQNGGVFGHGGCSIGTDGVMTLTNGILFAVFSNILGKGIPAQVLPPYAL